MLDLREDQQHEKKLEEYSAQDCIAYLDGLTDVIEDQLKEFGAVIRQLKTCAEDASEHDWELVENWTQYLDEIASSNAIRVSVYLAEDCWIEDDEDEDEDEDKCIAYLHSLTEGEKKKFAAIFGQLEPHIEEAGEIDWDLADTLTKQLDTATKDKVYELLRLIVEGGSEDEGEEVA